MGCLIWIACILIVLQWACAVNHPYWNAFSSLFYDINARKKSILWHKINKWRRWVGYVFTSGLFCYEAQTTTTTLCHSYAEKTWNVATHTKEFIYWYITLRIMKYIYPVHLLFYCWDSAVTIILSASASIYAGYDFTCCSLHSLYLSH